MSEGLPGPEKAKTAWPPKHCAEVNTQYAVWDAWWSGDHERLSAIYGGNTGGSSNPAGQEFFGSEYGTAKAGGIVRRAVDAIKRWFWGQGRTSKNPRTRVHVPLPKQMSKHSAGLLFAEPPTFTIDDPVLQARLDELLDDGAYAAMLEGAARGSALGGVFMAVTWDTDVLDRPWLTPVHPDAAVPEFKYGRLDAVTYWSEIHRKEKLVVRHLERHERGKIVHAVYEGTEQQIGTAVELSKYEATAGIVRFLDADNAITTGYDGLTSVYVPNMLPSPFTGAHGASLGASDYDGVEGLFDGLDMTASSLLRDVDLGKGRLVVPAEYMRNNGAGQGVTMDLDQEVYEAVNADEATAKLEQVQFQIRVAEHQAVLDALKREIIGAAGYSTRGFGLDGEASQATATEVNSLDRRDMIIKDHKARYWGPALAELLAALLHVDRLYFPGKAEEAFARVVAEAEKTAQDEGKDEGEATEKPTPPPAAEVPAVEPAPGDVAAEIPRPRVEWPPATQTDPEADARTLASLRAAELISIETGVKHLHPDWDKSKVDAEVARILDEAKGATEDPLATLGRVAAGGGFEAPPADEASAPVPDEDATEAEPAA